MKNEKLWSVTIVVDGCVAVPAKTADEAVARLTRRQGKPPDLKFPFFSSVFPTFDVNGIDVEHIEEIVDETQKKRAMKVLSTGRK